MNALPANLTPDPSDSEDVVSALETADVFWTKGDADEALRWLKRAAESAGDAGNDERALAIARSVADLKSHAARAVDAPSVAPKVSRPPAPSAAKAPPPPSAVRSAAQETSEVRRAPPPLPTPAASPSELTPAAKPAASQKAPPPLPSPKPRESAIPSAPSPRASSMPPAPSAKRPAATESLAPVASIDRVPATNAEAARSALAAAKPQSSAAAASTAGPQPEPLRSAPQARTQSGASSSVATGDTPVTSVRRSVPAGSSARETTGALTAANAYRAITVYVRPQGRNGDRLEVILAQPGQTPPPGAEPAILVPTRRGARLLG